MRRIFGLTIIAVFLIYFNLSAQPKIEIVGGDTYDWKTVTLAESPLKANIKIKNAGNEKLIISEVKPGCGCTTAPLDKTELMPGEIATMDVSLRLSGTHEISKSIRITSNDPSNQNKILWLKAYIYTPIDITPTQYFTFNEMKVGQESSSTLKLKNNTDKNVTLSDIEVTPDNVSINLKKKKVLKPGEEIELTAKIKPDKVGYFNCTVKMKTSVEKQPEIVISGFGQVKESPLFNN